METTKIIQIEDGLGIVFDPCFLDRHQLKVGDTISVKDGPGHSITLLFPRSESAEGQVTNPDPASP